MNSWRLAGLSFAALAVAAVAARLSDSPQIWHLNRAAGFVSYGLLWVSAMAGMALPLRFRPLRTRQSVIFELHRVTGVLALAFLGGHLYAVLLDPWISFTPIDVLLGFTAPYRPLALGLGSAAAWLVAAVLATTALSSRFSYRTWRNLHRLAFPAYVLAFLHLLLAGTDAANPWVLAFAGLTAGAVGGMATLRLFGTDQPQIPRQPANSSPTGPRYAAPGR
ncbi:ferric reductase-like transmembrane domain-containing protein [Tepidiforma sp.]|uniref:ferric reductase-like transmembrane domain-containing protein n=1 Tax=Tepidiforma sp. TaxID=2682230 RepID=UPI002ADE27E5|nr:ferric reductase-like transmembrane domain-containing protein [Tepidiforma sp.]